MPVVAALVGILGLPNAGAQSPASAQSAVTVPAEWQNLIGTWQGSLSEANRESRMVFRISPEGGKVKAVLYRIDQGGEGTPASSISREGSTLVITVSSIKGKYEGKLGSDRKAIAGTWTQGTGAPVLLRLVRATLETAWAIPDAAPLPKSMAADADPVFEVATIKPSQYQGVQLKLSPGGLFEASGPTLSFLIRFAYDLHARQIAGEPSWLGNERYDVTGKPDKPGKPSLPQLKAMIRKFLADRFQLTVHHEKRELPVYAITIAKSGSKLIENDSDPNGIWGGEGISLRRLGYKNMTMSEFAAVLQQAGTIVDRPVVDQTGFGSTRYDFAMRWTPDALQAPGEAGQRPSDAGAPPDLFTAFQEQLGLKLESTKAAVDVLVIDHVEKPSAN
jgi:uncharacterized protein (TIGR03435 family)